MSYSYNPARPTPTADRFLRWLGREYPGFTSAARYGWQTMPIESRRKLLAAWIRRGMP